MSLRARIARDMGNDREARRWAAAVVVLWSDADAFLQPLVNELRQLAT
jgi:hypothetical protein